MLRSLFITLVRQKNPQFELDQRVQPIHLVQFMISQLWSHIRGWRRLFSGNYHWTQFFEKHVVIKNGSFVTLGKFVRLESNVQLNGLGRKGLIIGNNVRIGAFSRLIVGTSFADMGEGIKIGNNVGIGEYAYLGGGGGLEIGDDCIIGQYLSCHPENHNYADTNDLIRRQGVSRQGIKIGDDCWIGAKVTILDGVTIGNHCVIAAGAVVKDNVPDYSVVGGVPARIIKSINASERIPSFQYKIA